MIIVDDASKGEEEMYAVFVDRNSADKMVSTIGSQQEDTKHPPVVRTIVISTVTSKYL